MNTVTIPKMTVYGGTVALIVLLLAVIVLSFSQDPTRTPIDIVVEDRPLPISPELQLILANRKIRGVTLVGDNSELLPFTVSPEGDSLDPIDLCDPALTKASASGDKTCRQPLPISTFLSTSSGTCYQCFIGGNFTCHKTKPNKRKYPCAGPHSGHEGTCSCPVPP